MSTKFIRFVAVLAVLVSVIGNTGVGRADRGAPPGVSAQNLQPRRAPEPQPLSIPPASSLGVQFVHVVTAANSDAHTTLIDHPLTNGNPNAKIIVTPNWSPGGNLVTLDQHHTGVFYNGTRGQWGIYNEDGAAMPVGATFNVIIPTAGVFVHTANNSLNSTLINNPLANNKPNAIIFVTPNLNPGNAGGTMNANFPIHVWYNNIYNEWAIQNQTGGPIPTGTSFNVFVLTAGAGVSFHTAIADNTDSLSTTIDNALTNGHPNAIVFVTPNMDPGDLCPCVDDPHPIAVYYNGNKWEIYNQDGVDMPVGTAFNVLVLVPRSDIFVHTVTASNKDAASTYIDNALTNGHPNAIVFTTLNEACNWNLCQPDSHNIGVFYDGNKWRIFNQDGWAMLVGNAFNVLVPNPDTSVFVHTVTAANTYAGYTTIIDYPLTNGNPNAKILVTPNYGPGGVGGIYDDHPIGVMYSSGKWVIFNQDFVAMPLGAAFNVFVPTAGPGVGVFVHTATAGNSTLDGTFINNALTNSNPNAIIVVTPNYTPVGGCPCAGDSHPIGVVYNHYIRKWAIFNQDGVNMPVYAAFNVYVFANYKTYLPRVRR